MKTRNTWMRTTLALCCALALLLGGMTSLAESAAAPLTEGIYEKRFTPEGRGEYVAYLHF